MEEARAVLLEGKVRQALVYRAHWPVKVSVPTAEQQERSKVQGKSLEAEKLWGTDLWRELGCKGERQVKSFRSHFMVGYNFYGAFVRRRRWWEFVRCS